MVGVPALLLAAVELGFRLGGVGHPTNFFLRAEWNGRPVVTENQAFGRRFFPPGLERFPRPCVLSAPKPAEALRVFVLGESAAMGDPDPKFGLPRMLEVLLRERFPQRQVQVVNAAMVAINSHAIRDIASACAAQSGDVWVVYMGNNEQIGPFGSLSVFGARVPPLGLVRAGLWVKTTRLGQALEALARAVQPGRGALRAWGGMTMWQDVPGIDADAPSTVRVREHFRRNLAAVLEAGRRAGVPILLCTVATNLRDCAPFASLHRVGLAPPDLAAWTAAFEEGVAHQAQGRFADARAAYVRAGALDDQHADLRFRWATCCAALGEIDEARRHFGAARDRDALQFRTDTRLNLLVREAAASAASPRVRLLDAVELFAAHSAGGVPGAEFFYEHVHFTPEGNYLLARAVAEQAADLLGLRAAAGGDGSDAAGAARAASGPPAAGAAGPGWLTLAECLKAVGFTDWNRNDLLTTMLRRIESAPFTRQSNHARHLAALRDQSERLRPATKPFQLKRAAAEVQREVDRHPDDPELRWNLAQLQQVAGESAAAEAQWRTLIALQPHAVLPQFNLARLLEAQGRGPEAQDLYDECRRLDPERAQVRQYLEASAAAP